MSGLTSRYDRCVQQYQYYPCESSLNTVPCMKNIQNSIMCRYLQCVSLTSSATDINNPVFQRLS